MESEMVNHNRSDRLSKNETADLDSVKKPLLGEEQRGSLRLPWMKLVVLMMVWFSFFVIYLLHGNCYGPVASSKFFHVLTQGYYPNGTLWIGILDLIIPTHSSGHCFYCMDSSPSSETKPFMPASKTGAHCMLRSEWTFKQDTFPLMALIVGTLGGVFGIDGGILISPLLLQFGVPPEVTAATCSFMVFFSSTMSAFQYLLWGMRDTQEELYYFPSLVSWLHFSGWWLCRELCNNKEGHPSLYSHLVM